MFEPRAQSFGLCYRRGSFLSVTAKGGLFVALVWLGLPGQPAYGRSDVQRDVEGYAVASCLIKQKEPYLKDQGALWADGIVQRSHGDIEDFRSVADAVEADIAQKPMALARRESDPMHAVPVPVPYCAEIVDDPAVRAAIDKAIKKLTPAYRRAKK
jgi:hypothetical protein